MKWIADVIMRRRAQALFKRVIPHLPRDGAIADLGSGTGHNADLIRQKTALSVHEFDVADLHWVGPGPELLIDNSIPMSNDSFSSLLMLFVLQYPESVSPLLQEARRVSHGPVIVVQSTYSGTIGLLVLMFREFFWGRLAFRLASFARLMSCQTCPLWPRRYYKRAELLHEFHQSAFIVRTFLPSNGYGLNVSRDLFVLERDST